MAEKVIIFVVVAVSIVITLTMNAGEEGAGANKAAKKKGGGSGEESLFPRKGVEVGRGYKRAVFVWSRAAKELHKNLHEKEEFVWRLLRSKKESKRALGVVLLSPFIWEGTFGFMPHKKTNREMALQFRKGFSEEVGRLFSKDSSWVVRVGCLVYYLGFPELAPASDLRKQLELELKKGWPTTDGTGSKVCGRQLASYLVYRRKCQGMSLAYAVYYVYCQAQPRKAISFGIECLQGRESWIGPLLQTRALLEVSKRDIAKIERVEDRKRIGWALGVLVSQLCYSFNAYVKMNRLFGEVEFPAEVVKDVLRTKSVNEAFRSKLSDEAFWFRLEGVQVDWEGAAEDELLRELRKLFIKQKKLFLEQVKDKDT